jgi:quinoprotein glucose dehydrogenase
MPMLSTHPRRWKLALGSSAGVIALASLSGVALGIVNAPRVLTPLPDATMAMADPALLQPAADWPAYGGSYSARRYSPLAQITPENVGGLKRAWLIHTGDLPSSKMIRDTYGAENTPLKVGDSLYVCTPKNIVLALDPATGRQRWRFGPWCLTAPFPIPPPAGA